MFGNNGFDWFKFSFETPLCKSLYAIFSVKPFIVLEAELDREGDMAKMLFEAMGLNSTKEQSKYWVTKNYRGVMRYKHMRRRNQFHTQIRTLMERKFEYVSRYTEK